MASSFFVYIPCESDSDDDNALTNTKDEIDVFDTNKTRNCIKETDDPCLIATLADKIEPIDHTSKPHDLLSDRINDIYYDTKNLPQTFEEDVNIKLKDFGSKQPLINSTRTELCINDKDKKIQSSKDKLINQNIPESVDINSIPQCNKFPKVSKLGGFLMMEEVSAEVLTLGDALRDTLVRLNIQNDVWCRSLTGSQWQVNFVVETFYCDKVLHTLTSAGFGRITDTSITVIPASFHSFGNKNTDDGNYSQTERCSERKEFVKSIKSRLTVAQVIGAVKSNATLTFDYIILILLASIIAGLGLAEDSSVVLVASMLISPLMGPIIGFSFGFVVENSELWKISIRNEAIGLSLCVIYGLLFGLISGGINNSGANWGADQSWPTYEMKSRGMLRSLWVGILVAIPSGAGVALALLGGNAGSLVGVAISASLLPPAVNAGMLWGNAIVSVVSPPILEHTIFSNITQGSHPPYCLSMNKNAYEFIYICNISCESGILGSVSLLLTISNIICIFIMGIVVLKVKEIAPHTAMSPATEAFWKKDMQVMRNAYRTIKGKDCADMAALAREFVNECNAKDAVCSVEDVIKDVESDPLFLEVREKIPVQGSNLLRHMSMESHDSHPTYKWQGLLPENEKYLTIFNGSSIQDLFSHYSPQELMNLSKVRTQNNAGSVLRMRIKSQNSSAASTSKSSICGVECDELMMIDLEKLKKRQVKHTTTGLHYTGLYPSSYHNYKTHKGLSKSFQVTTIPEAEDMV